MTYITKLPPRYYNSWDKKTTITQENMIEDNKQKAKFTITNKTLNINLQTDWYSYPFKDNHTITDLIFLKFPVLKDKSIIKNYFPIHDVVQQYKVFKDRPSDFYLTDGMNVKLVHPNDIIEIIEE